MRSSTMADSTLSSSARCSAMSSSLMPSLSQALLSPICWEVSASMRRVSAGNETARISWLQFRFRDESESSARRGLRRRMAP